MTELTGMLALLCFEKENECLGENDPNQSLLEKQKGRLTMPRSWAVQRTQGGPWCGGCLEGTGNPCGAGVRNMDCLWC